MPATCCQADPFAGENAARSNGYFFLLPWDPGKPKRQAIALDTLFAFDSCRSSYEASFIRTRARAFGMFYTDVSF